MLLRAEEPCLQHKKQMVLKNQRGKNMKKRNGFVISVRIPDELGERFDRAIKIVENEVARDVKFPKNIPVEIVIGKTQLIKRWIREWCDEMEGKNDQLQLER